MTFSFARQSKAPSFAVDVLIVVGIFVASLAYYGNLYVSEEGRFAFYQKYFHSAVNIYCLKDPDVRNSNTLIPEVRERLDLEKVSCREIDKSPRAVGTYYNGWHDTHPIFSTLMGYTWRWLGFEWANLWPLAGSLGALTLVALYLVPRAFGIPWYVALLLFPACVPFAFLKQNFYYLRDFSKVPFILLAFAVLGLLFRRGVTSHQRLAILSLSTAIIVLGMGFRQDALVLLPTIVAASVLTSSMGSGRDAFRLSGELAVIAASFAILTFAMQGLKTTQVAQLQGYPHFIVQGFADPFWKEARTEVPGVSFLAVYSDMLAWAAVDANSLEKVEYFATLDPRYSSTGFDLITKYAKLSAGDAIVRVFTGLSATSHGYWPIDRIGTWFLLLLLLIALGRWRLATFIAFAVVSLAGAGSIQFSMRHSLHLIVLDRALAVVVYATIILALWQWILKPSRLQMAKALSMGAAAAGLVSLLLVGAHAVQRMALIDLKAALESATWYPSRAALDVAMPGRTEALRRVTIVPAGCAGLEVTMTVDGEKLVRHLDRLDGTPRSIYFAVFSSAITKSTIELPAGACVVSEAWAALGDGSIPPLQMFDPEAALEKQTLRRLFSNVVSAFK